MNGLLNTLNQFGPVRLIIIMGVTIGVTLALMMMSFQIGTADKTLLYSGLDLKEASQISARLDQMGIPYSIGAGGSTIMVPRKKVETVRMALAGENLPSSGSMGYEIFDKTGAMGQTSFAQNMAQLRALQGELERTITSLDGVSAARVLLVMPKRRLFERDAQQAKASVVIRLQSNIIGVTQTQAIRQLVASAVPGLKAGNVTVADEAGRVLARQDEEGHEGEAASAGQRTLVEMALSKKITNMLAPIAGPAGVQVQISADLDLDRITERSTIYDPDNRVVISSDTSEESSDQSEAKTSAAVSVGANVPNKDDSAGGDGGKSNAISSRTSEILNYGNSKTERTIVRSSGAIKRLSVAVVVDGTLTKDDAGVETYTPRTPEQMKEIEALVKTAIGFDAARGDTVTVSNVRFSRPEPLGDVAPPGMFSFSKDDIMRTIELLILAVVSIAMMIFIVRPLLSGIVGGGAGSGMPMLASAGGAPALAGPEGPAAAPPIPSGGGGSGAQGALPPPQQNSELEETIDVAKIQGQVKASSVNKVAEIVDSHPEESISILRTWLHEA